MAAPKASSKTRTKWERIIAAGEASGLTSVEYCERNGINPKHYATWKNKLSESDSPPANEKTAAAGQSAAQPTSKKSSLPRGSSNAGAASKVDFDAFSVSATLSNGLVVEIKCRGEKELSLALEHLASL